MIFIRGTWFPAQNHYISACWCQYVFKYSCYTAVCQNLVPLVNIKIAGKWMFIPLKMVLIGIDPYPYVFKCSCYMLLCSTSNPSNSYSYHLKNYRTTIENPVEMGCFNHRFYGEPPFSTVPITAEKEMERSGMGEKVGAGGLTTGFFDETKKSSQHVQWLILGNLYPIHSHIFPCILWYFDIFWYILHIFAHILIIYSHICPMLQGYYRDIVGIYGNIRDIRGVW